MLLKIARWVRYWFGLQSLILLSSLCFFLYNTWKMLQENGLDADTGIRFWVGLGVIVPVELAIVGVSARAWYTLRHGHPAAGRWAIVASVLSLPVAGIGTIAGIFGLVAFTRREVVSQMALSPSLESRRLPGDGTTKLLDQLATGGQVVVLLVANHFWSRWAGKQGLPQGGGLLLWLLQFEIALQTSVLVHELGHVFGGWASRMKLRHFVMGPFDWTVRGGKWEFSFTAAGLWGRGATAMAPTSLRDLRGQRVLTTLGGPVGSLLAGCVGLLGALSAKGHAWEAWWACFTMLATLGLSAFVVNLIPLRPEDQYSDGAHLYQLLSGGPWADVHMAFSLAGATLVTPLRARDFDLRLLTRASRFLTHGKEAMLLRLFQYLHHVDAGRISQGVAAVAEAEALYPELAQTLDADLHTDFVFVNALFRRDPEAARKWWRRMEIKGATRFKVDYWKARTALLWLEGPREEAEEAWQKGNAIVQQLPAAGAYEFDRWCFRLLREALDERPMCSLVPLPPPLPRAQVPLSANPANLAGDWVPFEHARIAG